MKILERKSLIFLHRAGVELSNCVGLSFCIPELNSTQLLNSTPDDDFFFEIDKNRAIGSAAHQDFYQGLVATILYQ